MHASLKVVIKYKMICKNKRTHFAHMKYYSMKHCNSAEILLVVVAAVGCQRGNIGGFINHHELRPSVGPMLNL